jgi:Kef-type K+ transport system membrane component KefB
MKIKFYFYSFILLALLAQTVFAAGEDGGHGLSPTVLVGVGVILLVSSLFSETFEKFGQPSVLGEIFAGILLGNLILFGFPYAETLKTNVVIEALAQIGVIILLFEVGLETNLKDMLKVGMTSLMVAMVGVITPFFLGWLVAYLFIPSGVTLSHIFIGAMVTATSIGITARVLRDLGHIHRAEARIVLGAAVIDDVLALLLLGIVQGAAIASARGLELELMVYVFIAIKALGFLIGALLIGQIIMPKVFKYFSTFESKSFVICFSLAICFFTAFFASQVGLAAIIGGFAAGLILDEAHFRHFMDHQKHHLEDFLAPITALLSPIFFVFIGLKVDLTAFSKPSLLAFAGALTLAAVIGKLSCSLVIRQKGINKLAVGFGMVPLGEVVLFFASVGAGLTLLNTDGVQQQIVNPDTFSVIVILVMITTLIAPPFLKWSLGEDPHRTEVDQTIGDFSD